MCDNKWLDDNIVPHQYKNKGKSPDVIGNGVDSAVDKKETKRVITLTINSLNSVLK